MRLRSLISYLEAKLFEDKVGIFFTSICLNGTKPRHCPKFCVNGNRIQL